MNCTNPLSVIVNATGTFYNDRYKPLAEGAMNLILSIVLVSIMGVTGVIVATILTNLLICHVVEPYVLYKNAFDEFPSRHYLYNYGMIALFTVSLILLDKAMVSLDNAYMHLFVNGCISVLISAVVSVIALIMRTDLCISLYKKKKKRK